MGKNDRNGCRFRGAMMGYNKAEVDQYVARLESELEIRESRQNKWTDEIDSLKKENERLSNIAASRTGELQQLEDELSCKVQKNSDLEKQLQELRAEHARALAQLQDVKARNEQLEQAQAEISQIEQEDQETIRDSILAAQKMGAMLIADANQKAIKIVQDAQDVRLQAEAEGSEIRSNAEQYAQTVTEEAERECEMVRAERDRMLMDISNFKSGLNHFLHQQMDMLKMLPDQENPAAAGIEPPIDTECTVIENQR